LERKVTDVQHSRSGPDRNANTFAGTVRRPLDLVASRPFVAVCEERSVARVAASVSALA
jgi:hypothetical protein